jgi:hypothetical protein
MAERSQGGVQWVVCLEEEGGERVLAILLMAPFTRFKCLKHWYVGRGHSKAYHPILRTRTGLDEIVRAAQLQVGLLRGA